MALTKCKACGEEISKNAKSCPKCGEPQGSKSYLGKVLILAIFGFIIYISFQGDEAVKNVAVNQEQLKVCANEILTKNKDLMKPPPVGNWGSLKNIEVIVNGSKIEVIYSGNSSFTQEKKKGLDTMQKAFARDTVCSPEDIITTVK